MLLNACCLLLVGRSVCAGRCLLLAVTCCQLFVDVCCLWRDTWHWLFVVCWLLMLFGNWCAFVVRCLLSDLCLALVI